MGEPTFANSPWCPRQDSKLSTGERWSVLLTCRNTLWTALILTVA